MLEVDFDKAVHELEEALFHIKNELEDEHWGYEVTPYAPNTYEDLKLSVGTGEVRIIPVFSGGCELTIFSEPRWNHVMRFWHDYCHLLIDADFSAKGEEAVAEYMVGWAASMGVSNDALQIMWYDLVGQVHYYGRRGEHVVNQKAFVNSCIQRGIKNAVMAKH